MKHQGFVFIELVIVMAVITILAAVAIPAYSDYLQRSKVSEGLLQAVPIRIAISQFYAQRGYFPSNNTELGIQPPAQLKAQYVDNITIDNGNIVIQFRDKYTTLHHRTLVLKPQVKYHDPFGTILWRCGGDQQSDIDHYHLPTQCK